MTPSQGAECKASAADQPQAVFQPTSQRSGQRSDLDMEHQGGCFTANERRPADLYFTVEPHMSPHMALQVHR